jgi:ATP-dependent protease ClpP protease subunit
MEAKINNEEDFFHSNFVKKNKLFIYGDIDESIPSTIIGPLIELIEKKKKEAEPDPIEVYVNSQGGDLWFAFEIIGWFEYAKTHNVPIHTYVMASAFSAGSLIAVAGHKRFGSSRAHHGLHYASGFDYSDNPIMAKRNEQWSQFVQKELVKIYSKYTKLTDIENKLLPDHYYINGMNLKKYGLIDEML